MKCFPSELRQITRFWGVCRLNIVLFLLIQCAKFYSDTLPYTSVVLNCFFSKLRYCNISDVVSFSIINDCGEISGIQH